MSIKITICDDSKEDITLLWNALLAYDPFFEITAFTSGKALVDEIQDAGFFSEILFLDIYMPGIDGITTAREICTRCKNIKIIFLSSSRDHYSQAYDLFAFNYMLKPLDKERLYTVLDRAMDELQRDSGYKLQIQYKSTMHKLDCREIMYIESQNRLLFFHLADGEVLQCYGKLDKIIKELPEQAFFRCHQSFIVNLSQVIEMGECYFRVRGVMINISRKYLKSVKEQYYTYLFSHMNGTQSL